MKRIPLQVDLEEHGFFAAQRGLDVLRGRPRPARQLRGRRGLVIRIGAVGGVDRGVGPVGEPLGHVCGGLPSHGLLRHAGAPQALRR